ncbi:vitellogenin-like [Osmia bicornis bicornis]|uniref:vitellogenin-like n=1 Tax=Osmia bicornis bicornis TaxID=1437191 RepID=UPI001EAF1124|nr:vitellogenin-like [Osmia bicornis bicornis]
MSRHFLVCVTAFDMWLPLTLLVLAGLVSADYEHGWKSGNEYTYLVRSRTLTSLDQLSKQYTGILMKGLLTVQAKDSNRLTAKLSKPSSQYARIHTDLPEGWESHISDQMLDLRELPISEKPFEIKLKHGVIVDLIVDKDVPTWEVNLLKSIISQLQVDTQGENIIKDVVKDPSIQIPDDNEPYGSFKSMEDTVSGKCEVHYDITPLAEHVIHMKPELVPKPELKGDGLHIDILKTKNFDRCDQRMNYHFGITAQTNWEPGSNKNGKFLSKSSTSRIVISGNLKRFTIQSTVTTSKMFISPRLYDNQKGSVVNKMNLTLADVKKISNPLTPPSNPESTGNLVYVFDNPFSDMEERRPSQGIGQVDPKKVRTSDSISSVSSSEEALKNQPNLRGSGSSSASSSSISSSEENKFWQPKPTLEDAPQNPLLPNFIGYKGKFIGKSGEIDVVKAIKELVFQIANELEDPSNMVTQETLEKFSILTSLIRIMNRKQIAEVETKMHISPNELKSNDKTQAVNQNAWAIFRDAITQAGTGPALLTIKNWIERRDVTTMEAVDILSRLPSSARAPTAEYVNTIFELATNPKVMNTATLNTTALMAFTELVYQSQVNGRSIHNLYPVHTFGRLTSKHDQTLVREYIPFLAKELKNAVEDGDSPRIQTYIVALGNIGHPKILSVFEPYLEGTEKMSVFQRSLIVGALDKLARNVPKLARNVLYKIYLNTMESHEVRCMAVYLLPLTNPPRSMLQRMAEFTNYDTNKQVNSAVKSTIESLADLTDPEWTSLASKARSVKSLLNTEDYSFQYSHGFILSQNKPEKNLITDWVINYIGSDDTFIPRALYLATMASYGDFKTPPTELVAMISSVQSLLDTVYKIGRDKHMPEKMPAERIAEELNIITDKPVELEGNLIWKTKFLSRFMPFDGHDVRGMHNYLVKKVMAMKDGGYMNLNKFASYDITLSFPTETGLPFVYTLKVPVLNKMSGSGQLKMGRDHSVNAKAEVRLVYARKIQGRIGFVTPFEHHHYIAGIDVNTQAYAPVKVSLDINVPTKSTQLKLWPLKGEEKSRLIHYSVVPYTSVHNILSLRPLQTEKGTHKVHIDTSKTVTLPVTTTKGLRINLEADKSNEEFWNLGTNNVLSMFPWNFEDDTYRKADIFIDLKQELKEPLILSASYANMEVAPGTEDTKQWSSIAKAVEPTSREANSEDRRKQFLKEAAKGIKLAKSHVLDLQLQIPGEAKNRNTLTVAWSNSDAETKDRALIYWGFDMPSEEEKTELCAAIQMMANPPYSLFFDEAILSQPKKEFDIDIRYGETCSKGEKINIKGKATQSDELKEDIKNSPLAKECKRQMEQGNKLLKVCQDAAALALTVNDLDLSVDTRSENLENFVTRAITIIGTQYSDDHTMAFVKPKNAGKNRIDIEAKFSKDMKSADVIVHTPTVDMKLNDLDMNPLDDSTERLSADELGVNALEYDQSESSCVLDATRAQTFDGKEYPLRLGKCWNVLMTTYPKANPNKPEENLALTEENSVSILGRDTQDGQKEVKVMLGQNEIKLLPTGQLPEVIVNGQKVQISRELSHQERKDDDVLFEIFEVGDRSIGIVSNKFEVDLAFDGKRILIRGSSKFRNSLRGLCGNYDGDITNDFTSPSNCMLRQPDQFIASYTLTKDQCEGEDLENAKSLKQLDICMPQISSRQSNVISSLESGKSFPESTNWGYHQNKQTDENKRCTLFRTKVIEKNGKICFTTRPVVSCSPTCSPTETTTKNYSFYCTHKNEASLNMKQRIEKGANPDFSQKAVSMSESLEVPLACTA